MNIFVGNLPFSATEADIEEAFSAYGQVSSVAIIKDKETGQSRGFAFVEMPSASEGQAAIAGMNGQMLKGRPLTVNEARPREGGGGGGRPRGGGGGRGGGYGGGGGGRGGGYGGGGGGERRGSGGGYSGGQRRGRDDDDRW